jgi:2-phospho-L-lactate guanylyltransferase
VELLAVLVPIKAFAAAKGRLDGALDGAQRADLSRRLARGVLAAARPLPTWVVCDDDEVAELAAAAGASVILQPVPGLNPGVQHAVDELAARGVAVVVVAHADLPEPGGLAAVAALAATDRVVLVPDRHGDGTNVLAVPAAVGFRFAYGPASAAEHRAEAARLGLAVHEVLDEGLGWDADVHDDLRPRRRPTATSPPVPRSV